jgi:DNA-binding MarR family transcriptional regulator
LVNVYHRRMGERELGALLFRASRQVLELERTVLAAHGLEMWDYVVLSRLESGPASSQAELASASGRDRTRLIPLLDRLGELGLVVRTPDPADRRNRIVHLTPAGREVLTAGQKTIAALEEDVFAQVAATDRATFLAVLKQVVHRLDKTVGGDS